VVAVEGISEALESGADLLIDGHLGLVIVNPTPETERAHQRLEARRSSISAGLSPLRGEPAVTTDGYTIALAANVEFDRELPLIREQGAEGIGLYRTEFLYLRDENLPTEDEQTEVYLRAVAASAPHPVIFRTFDIGGDKLPAHRHREAEPNPFLGWRGIRVSLAEPEIFRTQVRAILRASAAGKVRIMFPMVATVAEIRASRAMVRACMAELAGEGVAFDPEVEIGAMIEVPGAALAADLLAREVDFFSIGSNDLVQYTLAVDRVNERVAELYQPMNPAVLRLMDHTVRAGQQAGIWVGVCGEVAGDPLFTPLLVGLGIDELSVGPRQVLRIKSAVRALDAKRCRELLARALATESAAANLAGCRELAQACYPELLE
jgi:phosphoenolpyruvate-protein phosphotransferase (PTS system enzyme I)